MLYTLADRVDLRIKGLHGIVDHYATLTINARLLGQFNIGADTHSHYHQVGFDLGTVSELHTSDAFIPKDHFRLRLHQKLQTFLLKGLLQQIGRRLVELALHENIHQMHHSDIHATLHQAVGRLQAKQAATNHYRFFAGGSGFQHGLYVFNIAETNDAAQISTRYRNDERAGTSGDQQTIIGNRLARFALHLTPDPVNLHYRVAGVQGDAVLGVPLMAIEDDIVDCLLASQHR